MQRPEKPIEQVLTQWLTIAVERFQASLKNKKIGVTQSLFRSFLTNIIQNSSGNISRLEISFLFYGRYVDMGAGRGYAAGGRKLVENAAKSRFESNLRRPKKWYSKTKAFEIGQLSRVLSEQYGIHAASAVETALNDKNIIIEL